MSWPLDAEFNYEEDWAGECRNDPDDGNAYVLRSVVYSTRTGYGVIINDIFGGHTRMISIDKWLAWERNG